MTLLLVMLGGAAGAVARHLVNELPPAGATRSRTLAVNVTGSFLLGVLTGLGGAVPGTAGALIGTGFCGALTTWSTLAFQTVDAGSKPIAALNVAATLLIGFGAVVLGHAVGSL